MKIIRGEEALNEFRAEYTGARTLELLRQAGGRLRIDLAVGVGKTFNLDQATEAAVKAGDYDLVVVLCATRRLIEERPWIQDPPGRIRVVNLRPRPGKRCGRARDALWQEFEQAELGAAGRIEICGECPRRRSCYWPRQYGKGLKGATVIYATQAHLARSPTFIMQLREWTGAKRVLVLLDEVNFVMSSFRRRITRGHLKQFVDVLKRLNPQKWGAGHRKWLYLAELLLHAPTDDLRGPDWGLPPFFPPWAVAVQACGREVHGRSFRFLGYDLMQFSRAALDSRERDSQGNLHFAAPPYVDTDFVIYSGTASSEFSQFRLGKDFASPFADLRFEHPGTTWYNLASRLGTKNFFSRNAPQILDFFAGLVSQRIHEGQRPLLVAKKCFVNLCAREVERRLRELGVDSARVVTGDWASCDLSEPGVVPLINYGMIGTNLFEEFTGAYCLTSYYVTERVVNTILQDVLSSDFHIPIKITTSDRPRRRTAGVRDVEHRHYDVHRLAPLALRQQEMDTVLQAVGRVRPYTRPREIVTFQCADHPQVAYTREFNSLSDARRFFAVPTRRARSQGANRTLVAALKTQGQNQSEVAAASGLSLRTVKRYWLQEVSATNPL